MVDLTALDGFDWDEGNRQKSWDKHHVSMTECEEVFFNVPLLLYLYDDKAHSKGELRFHVLGRTNRDRWLFLVFTVRGTKVRVISARAMSRKERDI